MNIQFENNRWVMGDFTIFHEEDISVLGFIDRHTNEFYAERRVVSIKFGMESPDITYCNTSNPEDTKSHAEIKSDARYAPVYHFDAIVSQRAVLFADGSNVLSADGFRYTEKVYSMLAGSIETQPSIIAQAWCSRDIDDIERNVKRMKEKYSTLYFLGRNGLQSRTIELNIQVVR